MKIRPCMYNHTEKQFGSRRDGRCGKCHSIRNDKYRLTVKGEQVVATHEVTRRQNPERLYYRVKWFIKDRIKSKTQKVAELERML